MQESFGERIIFLRKEQHIKQKDLANAIGITPTTLSRYEKNLFEPKAEILKKLAVSLNTSADFLIGLNNDFKVMEDCVRETNFALEDYILIDDYHKLSYENQIRAGERIRTLLDMEQD